MNEEPIPKRVWVQNVAVNASVLQARLDTIRARHETNPDAAQVALSDGVQHLVQSALEAAYRKNPLPSRWGIWWRGTLIEAAYQNLHAAESLIVGLYNDDEVDAEIPEAKARIEAGLSAYDPRRVAAGTVKDLPSARKREELRKMIEVGHAAADREHSSLRAFRNTILASAALISTFVILFCAVVSLNPLWVPFCFQGVSGSYCPTGGSGAVPAWGDVLVIAILGILGGALSAAVSIRNLKGTSTPYDVPVALDILKVPFGALTALGGLIAIRGEFVPGLSRLDSQVQILAYALVFGYAQQLLTGLIDRHAQTILNSLPGKTATPTRPEVALTGGTS